ncbi:MAG: hypothetical protein M3Q24_01850 [bacterium]|nr:hypothetical protein [bacterium]
MQKNKLFQLAGIIIMLGGIYSSAYALEVNSEAEVSVEASNRSAVSTFVQSLGKVADQEKGIGSQVRVIAKEQNESEASTSKAIKKVKERNSIKTFLVGTDYKNLGALRSELVKTYNRIRKLEELKPQAVKIENQTELGVQMESLTNEQSKIETFITANEEKFSLFGWAAKFFNKD